MNEHHFLFKTSAWLGQGNIQLSMVSEELTFFTRWNVGGKDAEGRIECTQEIQVKGLSDVMLNQFFIYNLTSTGFDIDLENQALGRVSGKGLINDKVIAWEFRVPDIGFEGFEFYELQPSDGYLMRAEYATNDEFRTLIQGRVWQPASS